MNGIWREKQRKRGNTLSAFALLVKATKSRVYSNREITIILEL
jgi:hypothetical protein